MFFSLIPCVYQGSGYRHEYVGLDMKLNSDT